MPSLRNLALGCAATTAAAILLLASFQDKLIYMPRTYRSYGLHQYYEKNKENFESSTGRALLEVSYNTSFGIQKAFWIPPTTSYLSGKEEAKNFGTLWVLFGGNAQVALDWLFFLRKLDDTFQKDSFLLVDYPGYGDSIGSVQGTITTSESSQLALDAVIGMLYEKHPHISPEIGIIAHSLGCAAGLHLSSTSHYKIEKLILISPFVSIIEMASDLLLPNFMNGRPYSKVILEALIKPRNHWNNLQSIDGLVNRIKLEKYNVDLIVIHGTEDEIVPYHQGIELYQYVKKFDPLIKSEFIRIPNGDHNTIIESASSIIIDKLRARL